MLNRYHGNSGLVERIDDSAPPAPSLAPSPENAPQSSAPQSTASVRARPAPQAAPPNGALFSSPGTAAALKKLTRLFQGATGELRELETEDILLFIILYLMYRESGDADLLIIIGAMLLP